MSDGAAAVIREVAAAFGERATTNASVLSHHAAEGGDGRGAPGLVIFAESEADVVEAVNRCRAARLPLIPYGAGTSLSGQLASAPGAVSLDLSRLSAILEVSPTALDCRVQAGVTREQLNTALRAEGLFFPVDPGANATIGGMVATRASGTNAVRYGTMRELTLGLTVVTAEGQVVRTGSRARKSSAGYDLTRLFVGSEGTLSVITEVQLRLFGLPERVVAAVCQFEDTASAIEAVTVALLSGLPFARIEFLDALQMRACIRHSRLDDLKAAPSLLVEFHGGPLAVEEQTTRFREIAEHLGGAGFAWAERPEDRSRLEKARHNAYFAARALAPGRAAYATDSCVPLSALAECVSHAQEAAAAAGLCCPIVGHVGDGNFHMLILYDAADAEETRRFHALVDAITLKAIAVGGTCTGEHGVGTHKRKYLRAEHGPGVELMRAVKTALDPLGLFNPGKVLPDEPSTEPRRSV